MSTDLAVHTPEPLLPMNVEQAAEAMRAYQELTSRMLSGDDWQGRRGGDQSFVKRRGWAKLATAYGVSTELRSIDIDRDGDDQILRARCIARATHPNGRYAEGDGACSTSEPRFRSASGRQKIEHDLPATAATRATNRAISNLIGFGAVSAEEVDDQAAEPLVALLDEAATREVAVALQEAWPNVDAHSFMPILARRFDGDVPAAAGVALRAWAWYAGRPSQSELAETQEPSEEPTDAPEPEAPA